MKSYLRSHHRNPLGFETLAILYSLPYSLLLWSTVAFFTAFGLEALLFSSELWARLPVGIAVAMVVLLIVWCVWTAFETREDSRAGCCLDPLKDSLVEFTRGLRGKTSNPGPEVGDVGDADSQGKSGMLSRSETLKEAFGRFRRPRRPRASVSTLVGPGVVAVKMDEINKNASGSAV